MDYRNLGRTGLRVSSLCLAYGLGVIPYNPLAGGFLTGKYRRDVTPESARQRGAQRYFSDSNWTLLETMEQIGKEMGGASISQIALAWMLTDSLITSPIIGPRSLEQLKDNLGAASLRLSADEKKMLDEATQWKD